MREVDLLMCKVEKNAGETERALQAADDGSNHPYSTEFPAPAPSPNGSGGMIPSTAMPFTMTHWVAQMHENYVSVTPYNYTNTTIHGFQGTHQPAIWMGESTQVVAIPSTGTVHDEHTTGCDSATMTNS